MAKIQTIPVESGFRKIPTDIYKVDILPLPTRGKGLTPMLATNGNMQIALPNRSIISVSVDGSAHMLDSNEGPILDFDSIKTGTLHASQILTVGDASGWRVELSGVSATYPIRYWNGTTTKFSLDKNGNVSISGSITASEIHIPSTAAPGFHVDTSGNVWWNSATLAGANHYVKEDGVAKFKSITLETSVVVKDLQVGSVIAGTYIDELECNKLIAGTGIIAALTVKNTLTMGDSSNDGIIQSYGWDGLVNGFQILGGTTPSINLIGGTITGGVIQTATSGMRIEINSSGYANKIISIEDDADGNILTIYGNAFNWTDSDGNLAQIACFGSGGGNPEVRIGIWNADASATDSFHFYYTKLNMGNKNLDTVGNIYPQSSDIFDLGDSARNWRRIYISDNLGGGVYADPGIYFGSTQRIYYNSKIIIAGDLGLTGDQLWLNNDANNIKSDGTHLTFNGTSNAHLVPDSGLVNSAQVGTSSNYWGKMYANTYYGKNTSIVAFDKYDDLSFIRKLKTKLIKGKQIFNVNNLPKEVKDKTGKFVDSNALMGYLLGCIKQLTKEVDVLKGI